jgi:hypothetical protein
MKTLEGYYRRTIAAAIRELEACCLNTMACPGPDVRPVQMLTCNVCRTVRDLRRALTHHS